MFNNPIRNSSLNHLIKEDSTEQKKWLNDYNIESTADQYVHGFYYLKLKNWYEEYEKKHGKDAAETNIRTRVLAQEMALNPNDYGIPIGTGIDDIYNHFMLYGDFRMLWNLDWRTCNRTDVLKIMFWIGPDGKRRPIYGTPNMIDKYVNDMQEFKVQYELEEFMNGVKDGIKIPFKVIGDLVESAIETGGRIINGKESKSLEELAKDTASNIVENAGNVINKGGESIGLHLNEIGQYIQWGGMAFLAVGGVIVLSSFKNMLQ